MCLRILLLALPIDALAHPEIGFVVGVLVDMLGEDGPRFALLLGLPFRQSEPRSHVVTALEWIVARKAVDYETVFTIRRDLDGKTSVVGRMSRARGQDLAAVGLATEGRCNGARIACDGDAHRCIGHARPRRSIASSS
jgi:hypothetical protein